MMLLRTNWLFVAFALVLATFLVGVQPAFAQSGNWRVVIMNDLSELEAKKKLEEFSPIGDVAVLPNNGKYGLFVGGYASKADAEARLTELKGEGWLVVDVLEVGTATSAPAPGNALLPGTASSADTGGFRVMVSTHATAAEADAKKQELETNHGLFPVDVVQDGSSYRVYVGYPASTKAQAEDNAAALRTEVEGVTFTVVDTGAGTASAPAIGISEAERTELEKIKQKYDEVRQNRITQEEYEREKQAASATTQQLLTEMEARRQKEEAATKYTSEIRQAANRGDFQRADAMLAEWKRIDQANPTIILMEEWLASRKREASGASNSGGVAELVKQAEDKERQGDMEAALSIWQSVKATANDDATRRRATNRVNEISEDLSKTKVAPPAPQDRRRIQQDPRLYHHRRRRPGSRRWRRLLLHALPFQCTPESRPRPRGGHPHDRHAHGRQGRPRQQILRRHERILRQPPSPFKGQAIRRTAPRLRRGKPPRPRLQVQARRTRPRSPQRPPRHRQPHGHTAGRPTPERQRRRTCRSRPPLRRTP